MFCLSCHKKSSKPSIDIENGAENPQSPVEPNTIDMDENSIDQNNSPLQNESSDSLSVITPNEVNNTHIDMEPLRRFMANRENTSILKTFDTGYQTEKEKEVFNNFNPENHDSILSCFLKLFTIENSPRPILKLGQNGRLYSRKICIIEAHDSSKISLCLVIRNSYSIYPFSNILEVGKGVFNVNVFRKKINSENIIVRGLSEFDSVMIPPFLPTRELFGYIVFKQDDLVYNLTTFVFQCEIERDIFILGMSTYLRQ